MSELRSGCVLGSFLEMEDGLSYQRVINATGGCTTVFDEPNTGGRTKQCCESA